VIKTITYKIKINLDYEGSFLIFLKRNRFKYLRIQLSKYTIVWIIEIPFYYTIPMIEDLGYIEFIEITHDIT